MGPDQGDLRTSKIDHVRLRSLTLLSASSCTAILHGRKRPKTPLPLLLLILAFVDVEIVSLRSVNSDKPTTGDFRCDQCVFLMGRTILSHLAAG